MSEIEIEGKTVEEAIQEGLKQLSCSIDNVDVKIIDEGATGLFGLMGNKPAKIMMTSKGQEPDYPLAHTRVKEILDNILKLMGFSYKEVNTAMLTGRLYAEIKSEDSRLIIGKNGQTLDALEHVLNLILNRDQNTRVKVTLDTEGYRSQQESRIQSIAQKAADQVKKTGKPYKFDPMPSKERRLIHLTLKSDPDVETISEGEGSFRKIIINPKNS